ncbi:MAG TPA: hypothetical protein EYP14_16805, partial [Planctomycetaceae bacterium]|nr:hypothetical protein [Planctomycetaceae bacterium]
MMTVSTSLALVVAIVAVAAGAAALFGPRLRRRCRRRDIARALRQFRMSREQLEARFEEVVRLKSSSEALKKASFEWHSEVAFGLSPESGVLTAFVSVSATFEMTDEDAGP